MNSQRHLILALLLTIPDGTPSHGGVPEAQDTRREQHVLVDAGATPTDLNHRLWSGINAWVLANLESHDWLWPELHEKEGFRYARITTIFSEKHPIYRENDGKITYDFEDPDRQLDVMIRRGYVPVISFNQMPLALSNKPKEKPGSFVDSGGKAAPRDYARWQDLVRETVVHWGRRYSKSDGGNQDVRTWYWEAWNEPNSGQFWSGSDEEFFRLYDFTSAGMIQAESILGKTLRFGGPAVSREGWKYLQAFFEHLQKGSARCDFVSYHYYAIGGKNSEQLWKSLDGGAIARSVQTLHDMMNRYPTLKDKPVLMTEWNIDGSARYPGLHTEYAASFVPRIVKTLLEAKGMDLAFYSASYCQPFGHSVGGLGVYIFGWEVAKPNARAFELLHLLGTHRVPVTGSNREALDVPIGGLATTEPDRVVVLLYNHQDVPSENEADPGDARFSLDLRRLPFSASRARVEEYRIDREHADSYAKWKELGSPKKPTQDQIRRLKEASRLAPREISIPLPSQGNDLTIQAHLPAYGVVMYVITSR